MYSTSNINKDDLKNIVVPNQEVIIKYFQEPLDLTKAWEIIKNESGGFTKEIPLAMKADELLAQLLTANGMVIAPSPAEVEDFDHEAEALALELELLQIELELENANQ